MTFNYEFEEWGNINLELEACREESEKIRLKLDALRDKESVAAVRLCAAIGTGVFDLGGGEGLRVEIGGSGIPRVSVIKLKKIDGGAVK